MKIVFICGSLEAGRDGVGDYTRRLASQLAEMGNEISIVAMNDNFLTEVQQTQIKTASSKLNVLRIPKSQSEKSQYSMVVKFIENAQPEWISLQYVPFSFNDKGLPYTWTKFMQTITAHKKLQIMFHELWVGMSKESSFKEKIWGQMQRSLIKSTIKRLKPKVINTQTQLYINCLNDIGYKAQKLALFGNIEVLKKTNEENMNASTKIKDEITFIMFGGIHANAPVEAFSDNIASTFSNQLDKVKLIFIGRCGEHQKIWKEIWESKGMKTQVMGEQPQANISNALSIANYGITTTPTALLEKSGSVAAMLEHGLTVINVSRNWEPVMKGNYIPSDGIVVFNSGSSFNILEIDKPKISSNNVETISQQFINELTTISSNG